MRADLGIGNTIALILCKSTSHQRPLCHISLCSEWIMATVNHENLGALLLTTSPLMSKVSPEFARYEKSAPQLATWAEENIPEGLTIFRFPSDHWRRIRTSNVLERVNREVRRRTRVATIFPNEASCLRLVSAVLMEISEEWETGRAYLKF